MKYVVLLLAIGVMLIPGCIEQPGSVDVPDLVVHTIGNEVRVYLRNFNQTISSCDVLISYTDGVNIIDVQEVDLEVFYDTIQPTYFGFVTYSSGVKSNPNIAEAKFTGSGQFTVIKSYVVDLYGYSIPHEVIYRWGR